MARISGVDIPREKRVVVSLTYLHGIGRTVAENICEAAEVDFSTRVKDLSDDEVVRIRAFIDEQLTVEGDLRREVSRTSREKWTSVVMKAFVIARGYRLEVNVLTRMLELVRVLEK